MKKILFICYGNICRSPAAEGIFKHLMITDNKYLTAYSDSAGTHDFHVGKQPDSRSIAAAATKGIDLSNLIARVITQEDLRQFDYLVVMDSFNKECIHKISPKKYWHKIILLADFHPDNSYDKVPDPFRGNSLDFEEMIKNMTIMIKQLIRNIVDNQNQKIIRSKF